MEKAVWSSRGFALMKVPEGDEQKAMVSANGNVLVEIDTLDNIIRSLNVDRIDFLKVDIEGAEAEALYGMSETLKITKYLMIELRPSTLWIINYLLNNGYDIIDCVDHGAVTNFLFLNKKFK
ncbi:FkbM family methyltransferase [Vulcanisaeta sp. JCM 16161]|uniref:FkbM family methyltransferase n=1 Tax=Vulcanisaeta sp. JCM 16161 TaxID=1295372 RepID=UPI001FB35914|nr:FkbM family methyltransferase [Vulcanisaeta sp. JCM 16161]